MGLEYGRLHTLATKQLADGETWEVSGYLSTFGNVDDGGDLILPGAFDATLASGRKVKFLFDHDGSKPLGPPLTLTADDHGLFAKGRISKTALGADVHTLLLDGALDSWSIGYLPTDFTWKDQGDGAMVRILKTVDLFEGSLVSVPMNALALVTGVKSQDGATEAPPAEEAPADDTPAPADPDDPTGHGLDYDAHAGKLLAVSAEFVTRTKQGAELRVKEGRAISAARRNRMAEVSGSLRQAADEIDALLTETAPAPKGYSPALALRARRLRLLGVPLESVS